MGVFTSIVIDLWVGVFGCDIGREAHTNQVSTVAGVTVGSKEQETF